MQTDQIILILKVVIGLLLFVIGILGILYFFVDKKKKEKETTLINTKEIEEEKEKEKIQNYGKFQGELTKESIYEFMEFDEVVDNMIVRKNRNQFVMVLQCNGVNYDLMSEAEKIAVEEGFVSFLNTLRFPIQIYVQSRTLNLREIIDNYKSRVETVQNEINSINTKILQVKSTGNRALLEKLDFEKRRKQSVLNYGMDITDYVEKMSENKNILQQKTFVIVSYYAAEIGGNLENFSKDEINNMCFTELYTRCQNVASALGNSQITSRILNSEELAELLYIAYNRDESELLQFSKALDSQYDSLYSTGRDVLEKKEEMIEKEMSVEAIDIATDAIMKADELKKIEDIESRLKRKNTVAQKAKDLIAEYEDRLDDRVFELALEQVDEISNNREKEEKRKKTTKENNIEETEIKAKKKIIRKKTIEK